MCWAKWWNVCGRFPCWRYSRRWTLDMSAILTFSVNVGVSCGRGTIYSLCMGYGPGRYLCWAVPGLTLGAHSLQAVGYLCVSHLPILGTASLPVTRLRLGGCDE